MTQPVKFSTQSLEFRVLGKTPGKPIYSLEKMDSVVHRGSIQKNGSKNRLITQYPFLIRVRGELRIPRRKLCGQPW